MGSSHELLTFTRLDQVALAEDVLQARGVTMRVTIASAG
jgi:hypothetical protein